jgi:hypothetical protein
MRPIPKFLATACSSALLIAVTAGCGGSDAKPKSAVVSVPPAAATAAPASPTTGVVTADVGTIPTTDAGTTVSAAPAVAGPTSDPCVLLTAAVATKALGVPVGEKITQPGQGNTTCAYRPADSAAQGIVTLTVYGVTGSEAVLETAALQFPDAVPVDGVGDAARVSVQGQAIGVLSGQTVFALGLFLQQPDGSLLPVSEDQLVAAARAVLDGQ